MAGPPADTYYIWKDGQLRHAHPQSSPPYTVQYHPAHTRHADSELHHLHRSFSNPYWSKQNSNYGAELYIAREARVALVEEARSAHDMEHFPSYNGVLLRSEAADTDTPKTAKPTQPPVKPVSASAVETYTEEVYNELDSIETVDGVSTEIEERLSNVEELALTLAGPLEDRIKVLESDSQLHTRGMRLLTEEVKNLPKFDATPLVQRIESLEQERERKVTYEIKRADQTFISTGLKHEKFDLLIRLATSLSPTRRNIWLAGPAGSGKTKAAEDLAKALGLPFDFSGAVDSPYKFSGYRTPTGEYMDTAFYRMYKNGGIFLADELDGSVPGATLEINAALSNGYAPFPCGKVERHEDFIFVGTANTWGQGGDANYVGRNKMDAAFLDRFVKIEWNYDEAIERQIAGTPDEWIDTVQAVRKACFDAKAVGMVISPRASITGCELLRAGMARKEVVEALFGGYRRHSMWDKVGKAAEDFIRRESATQGMQGSQAARPSAHGLGSIDFSTARVFGGSRR